MRRRRGIFYPVEPPLVIQSSPRLQSVRDFLNTVGKSALTNAVLYGLSAAVPPFGAVAIPAYTAYGYLKLGHGIYQIYRELATRGVSVDAVEQTSASTGDLVSELSSAVLADLLVTKGEQSGLYDEVAKQTGIDRVVFAEMMRGSTASALSTGGGELARFAIEKIVGA